MDEGQSRRSVSPYHEKCFPPYCDNAQHVDKAMVAKMPREDLEDKYITFADENLELKKQNKNQDRQIQRLQTAIARQDKLDKRSGLTPASMVADQNKVAILEAQNKNLQSKIKVLKQQLMNHSYIHSKEGRISDAKTRQAKSSKDSDLQMPSQTQSAREAKPDRNVAALKMRVAELEDELESQKSKYKAHIAQLEKELSALEKEMGKSGTSVNEQLSETSKQVKDNKELIKLRMQAEKHDAELQELQGKLQAAEEEVEKLQQELTDAKDKADDLEKQLDKERNKSKSVISQASRNTTHMETIRALEEQIRDLQNERDTLKDTNDKLLKLTQTKSEKSILGPKISQLENNLKDKMDELEEKEARIKDLEQQLADAEKAAEEAKKLLKPSPSQLSRPKTPPPTPSNEELDNLRDEVRSLQDTVDGLNRELASLKDEKMGLEDQLSFLRNQLDEAQNELGELRPIAEEHKGCRKTPSIASKSGLSYIEDLKDKNQKLEEDLNRALDELDALKPIVEEHKNCQKTPIHSTASKSVQAPVASVVSFKDQVITVEGKPSTLASEGSVHSRKTIDSGRYLALSKQLQDALSDNERLKQELEGRDGDDALKAQNKRLTDELNRALRELAEVKPIADEHTRNCGKKEPTPSYVSKEKTPQPSVASKTKTPSRQATPVQSVTSREGKNKKWPNPERVISNARREKVQSESTEWKSLEAFLDMTCDRDWKEKSEMDQQSNLKESTSESQPEVQNSLKENNSEILKNEFKNQEENSKLQLTYDERVSKKKEKPDPKQNDVDVKETESGFQFDTVELLKEETVKGPIKNDELLDESDIKDLANPMGDRNDDFKKPSLVSSVVNVKRLLRRRKPLRSSTISQSVEESPPLGEQEEDDF